MTLPVVLGWREWVDLPGLGRTAMACAFTVDPARSFLHGRRILLSPDVSQLSLPALHP